MGLDIYAGTFIRYYTRNWKTANQKFCEENGIQYQMIRAHQEEPVSVAEMITVVHQWQEQLQNVLQHSGVPKFEIWQEDNEKAYYTEKPDWDAYGALLLMTSAKALKKNVPEEYPKGMDFNHPLTNQAQKKCFHQWALYRGVCYFLPHSENLLFDWYLANGKEASFATIRTLREELTTINQLCWNADENTIHGWYENEGYPTDFVFANGQCKKVADHNVYDTESLAKFAFSILYKALIFAEENAVPIIFDF